MGFFDFFKKKNTPQIEPVQEELPLREIVIYELRDRVEDLGYATRFSDKYFALVVEEDLEISVDIMEGDFHAFLLPLVTATIHETFFPEGIFENVAGFGETHKEKAVSAVDNYMITTFRAIIDSLSDGHYPEKDFECNINGRNILWHPNSGDMILNGNWDKLSEPDELYEVVKNELKKNLEDKKLNWVKLFVSRQADGEISGECLLNNEFWQEGWNLLANYFQNLPKNNEFISLKQFVVLRRCDAFD